MSDKIALFDMDGTLFDYEGKLLTELNAMRSPKESEFTLLNLHGTSRFDERWLTCRIDTIKRVPGFWRSLDKFKLGWDIHEMATEIGFDIHILTKGPYRNTPAWTEKVECIRHHLPDATVHITEDKSIHYGRVLVDDWPDYVLPWLENRPRGLVIMPAHHYNAGFSHPNVVRYDGDNRHEVKGRLRAAFDRESGK